MKPFSLFPKTVAREIRFVLTDIDDTLTVNGKLPSAALAAMENLQKAGIAVVPITGRPAGWCDHIARMWPVDGVVGENGAFYFCHDGKNRKMLRRYWKTETQRRQDRTRLDAIRKRILQEVDGCRVSADQAFREADLAIDFCEDVPPLPPASVERIVAIFSQAGAQAKISSIHVNGWFGDYDKLAMTRKLFAEVFGVDIDRENDRMLFIGDSPNDSPMFAFFRHSVGVANILKFAHELASEPVWVTAEEGGFGFAEMTMHLLA